ncbi:TPA: aldo/keto reductase [Klebsiella pneumoniae]
MNYTHLGRTGLKVSRLCLGTMNFGDVTDEKTSARILDEALEAGINFIDTADVYGTEQSPDIQQGSGLSEEIIGRWLQQGGRRERIVLATKVYQPMGPGPNDRRLSAYHIRKACEDSLRRLKTDHIDVYQMHHIDRHTPWEEIWQAMELLVQQGKVLYIGSSNFAGWDIATAQSVATARQFAQSWARRKNTTPVQFALAWVMAQRPWIVPIPGTTQYPHLIENSGAPQVRLTDSELREIDAALAKIPLQGGRADPFTESQFDKS